MNSPLSPQSSVLSPVRVLHVIPGVDSRAGGPAVAMAGLCKAQRAAGLDVTALATWRAGEARDVAEELDHAGITVTLVGPARGPLASHRQLAMTLRAAAAGVDVVHAHGVWEDVQHQAAGAARAARKPYVITPHGMLTPWSLGQKSLKKKIYLALRLRKDLNRAAAVHFTSSAERDLVAPLKLQPPALVEPLGVHLAEFESLPPKGAFRAKFPEVVGRKIILFLGRLHPRKGMEYLIPALAKMAPSGGTGAPPVLVAVGPDSGGFRATLESMARRHGVADRVLFTGMLRGRERIEALADADVFALPSEHENFGIVVVEALACGTPVIVSDGVALHGEVVNAGLGASVPVGDVARLASELSRWLGDDALRESAAAEARPFVWAQFDWGRVANHWVEHYQRLSGRAAAAPAPAAVARGEERP